MDVNQSNSVTEEDTVIQILQSNAKQKDFRNKTNMSEKNITSKAVDVYVNENGIQVLNRSSRALPLFLLPLLGIGLKVIGVGLQIGSLVQKINADKKIEKNFQNVFEAIGKNYDAINRNYYAIKNVEEKVDRNFVALKLVSEIVSETLSAVEKTRIEMHQGFNRVLESIRDSRIEPTISKLNNFIQYFSSEKERIKNLPQNEHIVKLQEPNSILLYLKDSRTPRGDLHTPLHDIIEQGYAIPQNADDKTAFYALYALYYGTQTYISVMFFLLEQYSYLADYCYESGDIEDYNKYFDLIKISFQDFKHSLVGNGNDEFLIDKVINVLRTVQNKDFIIKDSEENLFKLVSERIESLTLIKYQLMKMKLPIIANIPVKLTGKPKFEKEGINTPIGEWKDGAKVSYAIQYRNNDTYSKVGEWSEPLIVSGKANPFLTIPTDPERRIRLIFRKFNNDRPQLVGVLENKYQKNIRDIDRDLYNAASRFNEDIAITEADTLISNGANINAIFDKGRRAIHAAALGGNTKLAQLFFVSNNATDINAKDINGYTPMHVAAETGHEEFVEMLIKHSADVNARSNLEKLTSLHVAAYKDYDLTVKTLMTSDVIDVNAKEEEGFTPLHSAVVGGVSVVQALMSNNRIDVNAKSKEGLTPLHLSSINNYLDITEILLGSDKVDINARAKGNLTALHFASMIGNLEIVKFLTAQNETDVNVESVNSWTPLHFAISLKEGSVVSELLNINSTNVNIAGEGNITPLHIAATTGQKNVVLGLLNKTAAIEEQTEDGLTALYLAAMHGNEEVVSTLIDNGANIETKTFDGSTSLLVACKSGHLDIIKYLMGKNASINVRDSYGNTPLHLATNNKHLQVVRYLVGDKDADFNVINNIGETSLLVACKSGHLDIIKYLIGKNASINVRDSYGNTPLHLATKNKHLQVVRYLVSEKDADFNAINNITETPLDYATKNDQLEIVKYFIEKGADVNAVLFMAASKGSFNIIKYIIDGGKTNINAKDTNGDTILHKACAYGHLNIVKYLIDEKKVNINGSRDIWGKTPLHYAVSSGNLSLVKYLVDEKNTNANIKDNLNRIPLHCAIHGVHGVSLDGDSSDIVKYLVDKKNADVNAIDNKGSTPLHEASKYGSLYVVRYLVEKGANIKITDSMGFTPLHWAARSAHLNIVKYFVDEKDIDTDIKDNDGATPLHQAAEFGNLSVVKYLSNRGSNLNAFTKNGDTCLHKAASGYRTFSTVEYLVNEGVDIHTENFNGKTALDLAIKSFWNPHDVIIFLQKQILIEKLFSAVIKNNLVMIKKCIEEGANVNAEKMVLKYSPLHEAVKQNYLNVVKYLVEKANANINAKDIVGRTPLYYTAWYGRLDIAKYLIEKNADLNTSDLLLKAAIGGNLDIVKYMVDEKNTDVNIKNKDGRTALHEATRYGHSNVVKYLIEKNADVNAIDKYGSTPLLKASFYGILYVVRFLVEKGANIKITDSKGFTPLHWAARSGHLNIVKYFIDEKNVDVNIKDNDKATSLHHAAAYMNLDVIQYLIEKNADVNDKDKHGQNPLHWAAKNVDIDVVKYLVEKGANINVQDENGQTPLHRFSNRCHLVKDVVNVVKYLVEKGADVTIKDSNNKTPLEVVPTDISCRNSEVVRLLKNAQHHVRQKRHEQYQREHLQERNRFLSIDARSRRSIAKEFENLLQHDEVLYNNGKATSEASKSFSWANVFDNTRVDAAVKGLSQFISSPFKPIIDTKNSQSSKAVTRQSTDASSTLFLLDVLIRKFTDQKYMSTANWTLSSLEAQGYALNITEEFEKVVKQAAKDSEISMHRLDIDFVKVQKEIAGKIIGGKFNEISKILNSYIEIACPVKEAGYPDKTSEKKLKKFKIEFNKGLDVILNQSINQILHNRNGISEVNNEKQQINAEPNTYLNNSSFVSWYPMR